MEQEDRELEKEIEQKEPKKRKKSKFFPKLIIFMIFLGIFVISLGFLFPGLLWTKSLGIVYTKADYDSIMKKLSYVKDAVPTGSKDDYTYIYGETVNVEVEFTSEELTAFFNYGRPDYYALKNVQIRINKNGTIDAVGLANVDYFLDEVMGGKYSREEIRKEIPALGFLPSKVNLSLNIKGSVENNKSALTVNSVSVQGITIPSKYVNSTEAISTLTTGIDNIIGKYSLASKANFEKMSVNDGKLQFKGSVPSKLERIKN